MPQYRNHLARETSPYLLQHAHNPVDWRPWGEEALEKARAEDKPILVSIGYSACHWCHVMERESFEDPAIAELMNTHFINIKIDREERPDLDHIYMDAVQAMTGSGGWPLNVFLLPDGRPFFGGTYFPPTTLSNRASWQDVLRGVATAFGERRDEMEQQAENLTAHLVQSNDLGLQPTAGVSAFSLEQVDEAFRNVLKSADREWGGFGAAPKFPQTFSIQFLLRYHDVTGNKEALDQAMLSLDRMIEGGIYDQLGGGLARYSTDTEWLAPHFEKMLYDNALFVAVLSEAYQLTEKERYKEVIIETMTFVQRELLHPAKGFYAALDADSEGEEGRFYVWDKEEVDRLLGDDAELFCRFYNIIPKGNWEGKNILHVQKPLEKFAADNNIGVTECGNMLAKKRGILFVQRDERTHPSLDDKIILGWNALMNTACSKAYAATGIEEYRRLAVANMEFLLTSLGQGAKGSFFHTWKNEQAKYPAFLDDYAYLIKALIDLQETTGDLRWLLKAKELTEKVTSEFAEPGTGFFFYTGAEQQDVIVRKKEVYDGATPSGNSVMAGNLRYLSVVFDNKSWEEQSASMIASLAGVASRYPVSFGVWNCHLLEKVTGSVEIVVVGKNPDTLRQELLAAFIPHRVLMTSDIEQQGFPLLAGKPVSDPALIYVCRNFSCLPPVTSTKAVMSLINRDSWSN